MKINWAVRFKNPLWVSAFVSQMFIIVQIILVGLNGIGATDFQLSQEVEGWILTLVNAVFVVLASLGVVQDPVTEGLTDSERAMKYNAPRKDNDLF